MEKRSTKNFKLKYNSVIADFNATNATSKECISTKTFVRLGLYLVHCIGMRLVQ